MGEPLEVRVHRGGHAVETPQQRGLAVEEVGLQRSGTAGEALPRRSTFAALPVDRVHLEMAAASRRILFVRGEIDVRRLQRGNAFRAGAGGELAGASLSAARGFEHV